MIVLDTTVLLYAIGGEHPYRDPCRDLIRAIADGSVRGTTTVEVLQEFVHVRARRRGRAEATQRAREYATLLSPLLTMDESDLERGLGVFERHDEVGGFDAMLLGRAQQAHARAIVSGDRGFAAQELVLHVLPDAQGVAGLLAG